VIRENKVAVRWSGKDYSHPGNKRHDVGILR
jgi:hypothetical protein